MTLAGCLAHVRRKYVEAKDSDVKLANHTLGIFSQIYLHENKLNNRKSEKFIGKSIFYP